MYISDMNYEVMIYLNVLKFQSLQLPVKKVYYRQIKAL